MKFIVFALILIPSISFSQINVKGVVCNFKGEPLPFTNIVSLNAQNGTVTDNSGTFLLLNVNTEDTLKISNIAYHSKLVLVKSLEKNDTVFLDENVKTLNEIVIANFSNFKIIQNLGFLNLKTNASFDLKPGSQIAVFIENKVARLGWIKEVTFKAKTQGKCKCGIRIRLMAADSTNLKPTFDLMEENVIINSESLKRTNKINLQHYKILMPKKGIFVVLEWLYSEDICNKDSFTSILGNMAIDKDLVWFNFRDRNWKHNYRPRVSNGNYMTPNIGIEIAY